MEPESPFSGYASGLMQIMPGTATHTVSMFSIPCYSSPSQLLDPETNINIGTSYLQYVYQQFGNNRIYASAAYNAGPGRVRTRRVIAPGASMRWRLSRVFRSRKRGVM